MKIISIKISNILSIEDAFVEFDDTGLVLVQGWNHDVGRANGAGKTAIFNALSFALYDKLPRKVTASEILRRSSKSGCAEVVLEVGLCRYSVIRKRPKGVQFFKEGEELVVTQDGWERTIGLNYTQFILSMYAAQGSSTRFLSINDSEKKQFLLQLQRPVRANRISDVVRQRHVGGDAGVTRANLELVVVDLTFAWVPAVATTQNAMEGAAVSNVYQAAQCNRDRVALDAHKAVDAAT